MAVGFIGYLAIVAAIAFYATKRTSTAHDYVIGGRSLSAPVAALSAGASDMSGWLLLGLPGAVFALGLGEAWIVVGLVCGAWANWRLVAAKLRDYSERLQGAVTLPQFFARRVGAKTRAPALVATLLVLFFFAVYTAAGFVAAAKLFESVLGLDYAVALWTGVVLVLLYTALGGFLAVSWTDFVQALLMLLSLGVVAALAFLHAPAQAVADVAAPGIGALALIGALAWGLGYFGQPHVLARFMAIDAAASVGRARRVNLLWMSLAGVAAIAVGASGRGYFGAAGLDDPETVFIALAGELLAPWIAGIVVAGVLAAVMSTVDSQLLTAATALVEDVVRPAAASLSDKHLLLASRATVVVIALAAGAIAADPNSQVLSMVAYAWAGLGASIGPAVLACLYWRRATEAGLVAGMLLGAATTVVWRELSGGVFDLYEIVPAFAAAMLGIGVFGWREPSAGGARGGLPPRMEEPSAGEREGPAPRMKEPVAGGPRKRADGQTAAVIFDRLAKPR